MVDQVNTSGETEFNRKLAPSQIWQDISGNEYLTLLVSENESPTVLYIKLNEPKNTLSMEAEEFLGVLSGDEGTNCYNFNFIRDVEQEVR